MAEYTKISSFIDLDSTNKEKEVLISQVEEIIAKLKAVGNLEVNLAGAGSSKEAVQIMKDLSKAQADAAASSKAYETQLKAQAAASKQSTQAAKEAAQVKALEAKASKDAAQAKALEAKADKEMAATTVQKNKAATEAIRTKMLEQKYTKALADEKVKLLAAAERESKIAEKNSNAYEQLKFKYQVAANTAKRLGAELGTNSVEFLEAARASQVYYQSLIKIEDAVGQSQRKVGQYENATFSLNQVLREAPAFANSAQTGFMAISNNLPILADNFARVKEATGSTSAALGIFAKSLFSWQTIMVLGITLLTVFGKQVGEAIGSLFKGSEKIDQLKKSQELLNKAFADSSVADAIKTVKELTINIGLAKQGFLDKKKVLKEYNDALGDSIGKAKDLDQAEGYLVKNADAYIRMTLYKAAANIALTDAAQKALDIAKNAANRSPDDNTDLRRKAAKNATKEELAQLTKLGEDADKAFFANDKKRADSLYAQREDLFNTLAERGADQKIKKEKSILEAIAEGFLKNAAEISKSLPSFGAPDKEKEKKDLEDFKKEAAKQALERAKILNDIQRTRLEGEANQFLETATNEKNSFDERYKAYVDYYNKTQELIQFNTRSEIAEAKLKNDEEKRLLEAKLNDPKNKLTVQQRKDLNDAILSLDQKAQSEKELIELQGNEKLLAFARTYEGNLTDLIKSYLDKQTKDRLEAIEKQRDALKKAFDTQGNISSFIKDSDLTELNRQLKAGEISLKQYNENKLAINKKYESDSIDASIAYYEKLLTTVATSEEEIAAIEAKIAELRLKKDEEFTAEKIKNAEKLAAVSKQLAEELQGLVFDVFTGNIERQKNAVKDQIDLLDIQKAKEIEVVNASTASAQEKADKVALIEARAAANKEALERRQRQLDQEKARFERAAQIARIISSTSVGVINALSGPPPAAPNPGLAAIIGAIGAVQLARVLASPIPRYKDGTDFHPGRWAILGDGGKNEYVHNPDGTGWITPDKPILADLPRGAQVFPDLDSAAAVHKHLAPGFAKVSSTGEISAFTSVVKNEMRKTREAIKEKRENYFTIVNGEITLKTVDGYNETDYLNRNLRF